MQGGSPEPLSSLNPKQRPQTYNPEPDELHVPPNRLVTGDDQRFEQNCCVSTILLWPVFRFRVRVFGNRAPIVPAPILAFISVEVASPGSHYSPGSLAKVCTVLLTYFIHSPVSARLPKIAAEASKGQNLQSPDSRRLRVSSATRNLPLTPKPETVPLRASNPCTIPIRAGGTHDWINCNCNRFGQQGVDADSMSAS